MLSAFLFSSVCFFSLHTKAEASYELVLEQWTPDLYALFDDSKLLRELEAFPLLTNTSALDALSRIAFRKGDHHQAIAILSRSSKLDDGQKLLKARCLLSLNKGLEAVREINALKSNEAVHSYALALLKLPGGRYEEAIRYCEFAIAKNKYLLPAYRLGANAYYQMDRHSEALLKINYYLEVEPIPESGSPFHPYCLRADVRQKQGKSPVLDCVVAQALMPSTDAILVSWRRCFSRNELFSALKLAETIKDSKELQGVGNTAYGDTIRALKSHTFSECDFLRELDGGTFWLFSSQDIQTVIEVSKKVVSSERDRALVLEREGDVCLRGCRYKEAAKLYADSFKLAKTSQVSAKRQLASALISRDDRVFAELSNLLRGEESNRAVFSCLMKAAIFFGREEEALLECRRIAHQPHVEGIVPYLKARSHFRKNEFKSALDELVLKVESGDIDLTIVNPAEFMRFKADVYKKSGFLSMARKYYILSRRLGPPSFQVDMAILEVLLLEKKKELSAYLVDTMFRYLSQPERDRILREVNQY